MGQIAPFFSELYSLVKIVIPSEQSERGNLHLFLLKLKAGDCHEPDGSRNDALVYCQQH